MTVRINKQKINLREKLTEFEDRVNFDEVVRGLGEYTGSVGIGTTSPLTFADNTGLTINGNTVARLDLLSGGVRQGGVIGYSNELRLEAANPDCEINFITGATPRMRIDTSGNVGIGTTDPGGFKLSVECDVNTVPIKGYRNVSTTPTAYLTALFSDIGGTGGVLKFRVEADGDVISATNSYTSDERAKTEISDLNYGIDTINQLQPKQFKMLHSEEKGFKYGFVAQEIETVLPDLVREDGVEDGEGGSYKALEYNSIIAVLTKAIQEQQSIIEDLKSRIETLESK